VKKEFAPEMVTAFIKLNGATVGAVANRTKKYDDEMNVTEEFDAKLTAKGCDKAAEFVQFCDAFNIPVLTLTNVNGYAATMCQEKRGAKATSKLVYAFANATVPKVNLIVGDAVGSAYVTMNSKATGADVVYAWPTAKVGMMEAKSAVEIMYAEEINAAEDVNAVIDEKVAEYNSLQGDVMAAAARGYVDSIIQPVDTRKYIIGAFEMLYTKFEDRPGKKHGTV
jgi:acetyl-CoA carboxylase carboxyltransferase component